MHCGVFQQHGIVLNSFMAFRMLWRAQSREADKLLPAFVGRLNTVLHVAVALVSLSIAFACFDNSLFSWHPLFMSIGFLLFMSEGLIAAVMFRHLDGPDRVRAIQGHALLQLRSVICIAVGFGVIYRNKVLHNKQHFVSLHAKVGLAALILSAISPVWGLVSFRRMGIIQKFPEPWQPRIKMLHRQIGTVSWFTALAAIELALTHHAVKKAVLTPIWQVSIAAIGGMMALLLLKARVKAKEDVISKAV